MHSIIIARIDVHDAATPVDDLDVQLGTAVAARPNEHGYTPHMLADILTAERAQRWPLRIRACAAYRWYCYHGPRAQCRRRN